MKALCRATPGVLAMTNENERALGDFRIGRYGFIFTAEALIRFLEPIPCQGVQGFWEWKEPQE